jgi:hypothetical protein
VRDFYINGEEIHAEWCPHRKNVMMLRGFDLLPGARYALTFKVYGTSSIEQLCPSGVCDYTFWNAYSTYDVREQQDTSVCGHCSLSHE